MGLTRDQYLHLSMQIVLASRKRLHYHPLAGCEVSVGTDPQGDPPMPLTYEVTARYRHGSRAVLVVADNARAAIDAARAELRSMLPQGQRITAIWAILAY